MLDNEDVFYNDMDDEMSNDDDDVDNGQWNFD